MPGSSKPFLFKHFTIYQDQCAMKIGTDAFLLGGFMDCSEAETILDIGTGTGVLSLLAAQKSNPGTKITAIEINQEAAQQAASNAAASPWSDRIKIVHTSLQEFYTEGNDFFDLIVCNPPYFSASIQKKEQRMPGSGREMARSSIHLTLDELLLHTKRLLHPMRGRFMMIFPFERKEELIKKAQAMGFYIEKEINIRSFEAEPYIRCILQLTPFPSIPLTSYFTIYKAHRKYSDEYSALTREIHGTVVA